MFRRSHDDSMVSMGTSTGKRASERVNPPRIPSFSQLAVLPGQTWL